MREVKLGGSFCNLEEERRPNLKEEKLLSELMATIVGGEERIESYRGERGREEGRKEGKKVVG